MNMISDNCCFHYLLCLICNCPCVVLDWCHVICALFIPEAWFGDTATMEPIILNRIPADRYNKVRGMTLSFT